MNHTNHEIIYFAIQMGLIAGIIPSPHTVLMINQLHFKEKKQVALGGLLIDLVIIAITFFLGQAAVKMSSPYLGLIFSLCFFYLGLKMWGLIDFKKEVKIHLMENNDSAFIKGMLTHAKNPNPYLFWFGIVGQKISNPIFYQINPLFFILIFASIFLSTCFFCKFLIASGWPRHQKWKLFLKEKFPVIGGTLFMMKSFKFFF